MAATKGSNRQTRSIGSTDAGFSETEKAAMTERAAELSEAQGCSDGEAEVLAKIACATASWSHITSVCRSMTRTGGRKLVSRALV